MKVLVALVCLCTLPLVSVSAADRTALNEARREFIANFKRSNLNTTPGDAMMLRILVASRKAKRGVEIGTATGYGAINMGVAFERNGGHLTTLEIDPKMAQACRENLKRVKLDKVVTCVEGDALKTIPTLKGPFDFVFIDAMKSDYMAYFKLLEPKLTAGAVVVADNVIRHKRAMQDYLTFMHESPDYETAVIRASEEKGDGMAISYKVR